MGERHFWVRLGWWLSIPSSGLFALTILAIFLDVPFEIINVLYGISLPGIFLGAFSIILFGQIGWARSNIVDFLLNRLGPRLTITGIVLDGLSGALDTAFLPDQSYSYGVTIVGVVLVLLGIRFQSSN